MRLPCLPVAVLLLLPGPLRAGFEDSGLSPRAVSMGGALTAVEGDPVSWLYNPANLGSLRQVSAAAHYLRQFHIPAGEVDDDQINAAAGFPLFGRGSLGLAGIYNRQNRLAVERTAALGYGSRGLWELEGGAVELGAALRLLKRSLDAGGGPKTQAAFDLGALYRFRERYAVGLSVINANRPRLDAAGLPDRAPAMVRLGVAESVRGFTAALDAVKREPSGGRRGTATLGLGFENWWPTARRGSFALRAGLSLGDRTKTWAAGLGWRRLGGRLDYALTVPMAGTSRFGHAVSLTFRFGGSHPEGEYEKVLAQEMRYRKDLSEALEAGEIKQWKLAEELKALREELEVLREELEILRAQLLDKTASEAEARQRMKALQERHQRAVESYEKMKADTKALAEKTSAVLFEEDWRAYQKLKLSGAPNAVFIDQVRRLLRQYKETGVDLSPANQELLRLLRAQ